MSDRNGAICLILFVLAPTFGLVCYGPAVQRGEKKFPWQSATAAQATEGEQSVMTDSAANAAPGPAPTLLPKQNGRFVRKLGSFEAHARAAEDADWAAKFATATLKSQGEYWQPGQLEPVFETTCKLVLCYSDDEYLMEAKAQVSKCMGVAYVERVVEGQRVVITGRSIYVRYHDRQQGETALRHEIAHQYFAHLVKITKPEQLVNNPKKWLNEGFAVFAELPEDQERFLRSLKGRGFIPMEKLMEVTEYPSDTETNLAFYGQSMTSVMYLVYLGRNGAEGRARFIRFAQDLCDGGDPLSTLNKHYLVKNWGIFNESIRTYPQEAGVW